MSKKKAAIIIAISILSFIFVILPLLSLYKNQPTAIDNSSTIGNETITPISTPIPPDKQPLFETETPQPIQQPQPTPMQQANQSEPQWVWTTAGGNSYTLPYPSNWKVEETPRVTSFDKYETVFTTDKGNRISLSISPSSLESIEEFRTLTNFLPSGVRKAVPDAIIEGSGFGYYSLGGLETYGMLVSTPSFIPGVDKKGLSLQTFINGWDVKLMYFALDYDFNSEMPIVQHMINSLYFNA